MREISISHSPRYVSTILRVVHSGGYAPEICEMRDGSLDSERASQRGRVSRLSLSEFARG
ncbi:hypothetical protein VCRA2120E57_900003 [Vibrio crassostreae]|nr:hypothetical protein VCRA2120E57_900003 [Vibrio crassostreae]